MYVSRRIEKIIHIWETVHGTASTSLDIAENRGFTHCRTQCPQSPKCLPQPLIGLQPRHGDSKLALLGTFVGNSRYTDWQLGSATSASGCCCFWVCPACPRMSCTVVSFLKQQSGHGNSRVTNALSQCPADKQISWRSQETRRHNRSVLT